MKIRLFALVFFLILPHVNANEFYSIGFSERDITPQKTLTMGGFGTFIWGMSTRKNTEGVHDPIKTNSMCLSYDEQMLVAIASVDVIGLTSNSIQRINEIITKQYGPIKTIVAATHNHHSPDTFGIWGALPNTGRDQEYMAFLERSVAQVIIDSCQNRQTARLKIVTQNLNNVRKSSQVYDDQAVTLFAEAEDGRIFGTLTQWSSSPSTLSKHNNSISADFVGAYRYYLSKIQSGIHVYVNGALGKVHGRPESVIEHDPFVEGNQDPDIKERYIKAANLGYVLAQLVHSGLPKSTYLSPEPIRFVQRDFSIPMKSKVLYYLGSWDIIDKQFKQNHIQTSYSWLKLGELQILSVPGEMFPNTTSQLRQDLITYGEAKQTMVIGLAQDWLGYLLSQEQYDDPDLWYYRLLSPHRDASALMRQSLLSLLDYKSKLN